MSTRIPTTLYIHIPWCEKKCPYCDFNSHEGYQASIEEPYRIALLNDLRDLVSRFGKREICSIFIGGGTPSLFSSETYSALLIEISKLVVLPSNLEITIESNPGSADVNRFEGYRNAGINRLSLGVQSFNDKHLRMLGRVHSSHQAIKAIISADSAGFKRINLDIMFGLPNQTQEEIVLDIKSAIAHSPEHISWYQLTIEPNTIFWQSRPKLPNETITEYGHQDARNLLEKSGFMQYEVSSWSQGNAASEHNQNYWQFGDYFGIGAGAHGKVTNSDNKVFRYQRTRIPRNYLNLFSANKVITSEHMTIPLESNELAGEFLMNALRLRLGVPTSIFEKRTGLPLETIKGPWQRAISRGLMVDTPDQLVTTDRGFKFLDSLVADFL